MKPTTLRLLLFAIFAPLFVLQLIGSILAVPIALRGHADFRSFYVAGYAVRTGHAGELYDYELQKRLQNELVSQSDVALLFYHPACETLLFVPLSLFTYRTAYFVFLALNAISLALAIQLVRRHLPHLTGLWTPLPIAIFLCFFPIGIALTQGQDSILLLLLYTASFVALIQGNDMRAGLFLGLATVKFQIAIPVALLFFFWKRWRFVVGFAIAGSIVLAASVGVVGVVGTAEYLHPLLAVGGGLSTSAEQVMYGVFPHSMPNMRGLVDGLAGHAVSIRIAHFTTALASLLVLAWTAMRRKNFSAAVIAALVVSYHLNLHDLSVLALPIAIVFDRAAGKSVLLTRRDITAVSLAAILVFTPIYLLLTPSGLLYLLAVPMTALLFVSPAGLEE